MVKGSSSDQSNLLGSEAIPEKKENITVVQNYKWFSSLMRISPASLVPTQ